MVPTPARHAAPPVTVQWTRQATSLGPAEDLDYGITLLRAAQRGVITSPMVRVYRPAPTVAFGQRDTRLPGFARAQQACRTHGFAPVVRRAGGRAAAYHAGSVVVDHIQRDQDAMQGFQDRFAGFGEMFAQVFRSAGVPAAVGEIPGEYCPGEYSVYTPLPPGPDGAERGPVKLAGTAQRVVKGAWLFSSSIVVEDPEPIRAVLVDVYEALGLEWDPATAGAATDAVPVLGVETFAAGLRVAYQPVEDRPWAHLLESVPPGSAVR
ncbi:lipoate--protein ligase family protein [Cellulosimicrobium funkei]|nr:lipoate--protein ligase family protein [Cellulosimicrobium funkei]